MVGEFVGRTSAPGKTILIGEHAVVYGKPAIAVPVTQLLAQVDVFRAPAGSGMRILSLDLGCTIDTEYSQREYSQQLSILSKTTHPSEMPSDPLPYVVYQTLQYLGLDHPPDVILQIHSDVPLGRGLGSSAAVATALVRATCLVSGHSLPPEEISHIVFQTEILQHGTPSGIDNTVIAYEQPIFYSKGRPLERLHLHRPLHLCIGDTGIPASTRATVAAVRQNWERDPAKSEGYFNEIGQIVTEARLALEIGQMSRLGQLLTANHHLLQQLQVSSPELDRLVVAALQAGALGAKLSGGGGGGIMLALVNPGIMEQVQRALKAAGASQTWSFEIS
ncbi:MAG: mevalonate kinase [Chloroflexi bacterium]|nr:mevalonate kinase [Chloroflexota bacterium]